MENIITIPTKGNKGAEILTFEENDVTYEMVDIDINSNGRVKTTVYTVEEICKRFKKGEICRDVLIQRTDDQWNKKQKSLLIMSILYERPIGTILITGKGTSENRLYEKHSLIDGLQRTTAIYDFVENRYSLSKDLAPIMCMFKGSNGKNVSRAVDISGKKFCHLPVLLQSRILNTGIPVNIYRGFTDDELDSIVFCTNNGTSPKIGQKIRFTLGTQMMKYIQPICDGTFWEKAKGCKAKNDTILIAVIRSLAMLTGYDCKSYGTAEILNFATWYAENGSFEQIEYLSNLFDQLDDNANKLPEVDWEFFDACNIPHIIMNLDKFNSMENPEKKSYSEFIREFICSDSYREYSLYCHKTGSGGAMYSIENSDERQYIIDGYLEEFLDYLYEQDTETEIYDSIIAEALTDNSSDNKGLSDEELENIIASA